MQYTNSSKQTAAFELLNQENQVTGDSCMRAGQTLLSGKPKSHARGGETVNSDSEDDNTAHASLAAVVGSMVAKLSQDDQDRCEVCPTDHRCFAVIAYVVKLIRLPARILTSP